MIEEPPGPWMILMVHEDGREVWSPHHYACKRDADEWIDTFPDEWTCIFIQCDPS